MTTTARHSRRALIGIVTSTKTKKTITVEVERTFKHAKYGKYLRKRKRYLAHDEDSVAKVGDNVELASTRPMSKRKRWRLLRVVTRSELGGIELPDAAAQIMADITGKPLGSPAGDTGSRAGTEAGQ
ncbi:MAG: 30S ribosomal protein S17 [Planctomycetes bacterium]|nr:30S ribosomal protein S17 [Planctomycetota bacterium]